jgi:hypothetical protein
MRKRRCSKPVKSLKLDEGLYDTLKFNMPNLDKLFTALVLRNTPNFLDIIAGIAEKVAFYIECDINSGGSKVTSKEMSEKKCRNCS